MLSPEEVRVRVYANFIRTGHPPRTRALAEEFGVRREDIERVYRELAAARSLVLKPGGTRILMAPPFSAVPTAYSVNSARVHYYANSAWDVFGIATVLGRDVSCIPHCPDCFQILNLSLRGGALENPSGIVHFVMPPKRFWEHILYTCHTILAFRSEEHVDRWCEVRRLGRGAIVTLEQCFRLGQIWYADRHKPGWKPRAPIQLQTIFDFLDLTGPFWRVI